VKVDTFEKKFDNLSSRVTEIEVKIDNTLQEISEHANLVLKASSDREQIANTRKMQWEMASMKAMKDSARHNRMVIMLLLGEIGVFGMIALAIVYK